MTCLMPAATDSGTGYTAAYFSATIHAVIPALGDIDVICLGTPIWIRA